MTPKDPREIEGINRIFLAHAESEKPFVEKVKDTIVSLSRSSRVRRLELPSHAPPRARPEVFYDKDNFSPSRNQSLADFTQNADAANTFVLFVPAGGFHARSFVGKELLAFMTGIVHGTREAPDPQSLTAEECARARRRINKVLVVDRYGALTWLDGGTPAELPAICREGVLQYLFREERPRLREQSARAEDVAAAALARLWSVPPERILSRLAAKRRRDTGFAAGAAVVMALLALVAYFEYRQANSQFQRAERERAQARGNELAALAESARGTDPSLAALLAVESHRLLSDRSLNAGRAEQALRNAAADMGGLPLSAGSRFPVIEFSQDSQWLFLLGGKPAAPELGDKWGEASLFGLQNQAAPEVRARWIVANPVRAAVFVGENRLFLLTDGHAAFFEGAPGEPVSKVTAIPHDGDELGGAAPDTRGQFILAWGAVDTGGIGSIPMSTLRLLEFKAGQWTTVASLSDHSTPIAAATFQGESHHAATADKSGTVIVWKKTDSGLSRLRDFRAKRPVEHEEITQVRLLPGGRWLTAFADKATLLSRVLLFDLQHPSGGDALNLGGIRGRIQAESCSDGQWLVASGEGGVDTDNTLAWLVHTPLAGAPHSWSISIPSGIKHSALSADCRLVAFATGEGLVQYRLEGQAKPIKEPTENALREPMARVAVSPDGRWVAVGGARHLYLMSGVGGRGSDGRRKVLMALLGHTSTISGLGISPDGRKLVSVSQDSARMWDLRNPQPTSDPVLVPDSPGTLTRKDLQETSPLALAASLHASPRTTTSFNHERHTAAETIEKCAATQFATGIRRIIDGLDKVGDTTIVHSRSCRWLATGQDDQVSAFLFDLRSPASRPSELAGHVMGDNPGWKFAFSPGEKWLATVHSGESEASLWTLPVRQHNATRTRLNGDGTITGMVFSADDASLLLVADRAELWHLSPLPSVVTLPLGEFNFMYAGALWTRDRRYAIGSGGWNVRDDAPKSMYSFAWLGNVTHVIEVLAVSTGRNFSLKEWTGYFPGDPYRKTFATWPVAEDAFADLVRRARDAANNGMRDEAAQAYRRAAAWTIEDSDARRCNQVAWWAALDGHAKAVTNAAAAAVHIAPYDPDYWDTLGLVEALSGRRAEAIRAFDQTLQLAASQGYQVPFVETRRSWRDALKAGKNPFDERELARLRGN